MRVVRFGSTELSFVDAFSFAVHTQQVMDPVCLSCRGKDKVLYATYSVFLVSRLEPLPWLPLLGTAVRYGGR